MMRTAGHHVRRASLVAILAAALCALFVVPGSAQADGDLTKLSASQRLNIVTSGHPHLMKACDVGLDVATRGIRTRTTGKKDRGLIVAQTTCFGATSGSPTDTGVYDRAGRELYLIDTGRTFHKGARWVTPVSVRKIRKGVVAVVYAGYLPDDPMCCASRFYERVFKLHAGGAGHGKLHRVPTPR